MHRIHLLGPWEIEFVSRAAVQTDGQVVWSDDVPPPITAKLPCDPAEVVGTFRGRVRYARGFNKPTNLGPREKVWIVIENVRNAGSVQVNNVPLGTFTAGEPRIAFDATPTLRLANVLTIELESIDSAVPPGIVGLAAIEIEA